MQFTPQEKKLIQRLRQRERRWPQSEAFSEIPGAIFLIIAIFPRGEPAHLLFV